MAKAAAKAPRRPASSEVDNGTSLANLLGTLGAPSPTPTGPEASPFIPSGEAAGNASPVEAEAPTVRIANMPTDDLVLPGFAMADSPEELPDGNRSNPPAVATPQEPELVTMVDQPPASAQVAEIISQAAVLDGEILSAGAAPLDPSRPRYESRIRVLEAWQYPGRVPPDAPAWIDRSWIGYADYDPLRGIEPGPCLRVPMRSGDMSVVRPGDFVVQQEVILARGVMPEVVLEVWSKEAFTKTFIPA